MSDQKAIQVSEPKSLRAIMRSDQIVGRFEEIVGNGNAGGYISSVLIAASQNQDLMACEPNSIIGSALRAATMELSVDPSIGQAYLVPFGRKCTLIVGYKGLYHMAIRTGKYKYLNLVEIYEDDDFVLDRTTGNFILKLKSTDIPVLPQKRARRGQVPAGYMLYMELLSGFKKSFFMTCEECDEHGAKYSKTYNSPNSLWKKDPHKMYQKTVVRLGITKWGYLDPHDLMSVSELDEVDDDDTPDYVKGIEIKEVHQTVEENLGALGFGNDEPEEPPSEEPTEQVMTYEQAFNVSASNGALYGNMTNDQLNGHRIGITNKLKTDLSQKEQDELLNKLEAIKILTAIPDGQRLQKQGQQALL